VETQIQASASDRVSKRAMLGRTRMKRSEYQISLRLWGDPSDAPDIIPTCPQGWVPWREPSAPLPIDEFVSRLSGGIEVRPRGKVKLRPVEAFAKAFPDMCPYEVARRATLFAVSHGLNEQRKADVVVKEIRSKMQAAKEPLRQIEQYLSAVMEPLEQVLKLADLRTSHNMLLQPDLSGLHAIHRARELLAKLGEILPTSIAEVARLRMDHAQTGRGDVWGIEFVSVLGDVWVGMVGETPTPTGLFAEFVDAAWNSLEDPARSERR
jgi:hypothetical protein